MELKLKICNQTVRERRIGKSAPAAAQVRRMGVIIDINFHELVNDS